MGCADLRTSRDELGGTFIVHDEPSEEKDWSGGVITPRIGEVRWAAHAQDAGGACGWLRTGPSLCRVPEVSRRPRYFPASGTSIYRTAGPCLTESCDVGGLEVSLRFFQTDTIVGLKWRQERLR